MGNFRRKDYLMLHHLASATMQIANLVTINAILQEDFFHRKEYLMLHH